MCDICEGQIILRTADGFEQIVKVKDCDIYSFYTAVFNRHKSCSAFFHTANFDDIPQIDSVAAKREYKFQGELRYGIRVLDEIIEAPHKVPRTVEALDKCRSGIVLDEIKDQWSVTEE